MKLIYPPHPAITWHPRDIHKISGFIAQYKFDDWRILICIMPDGAISFYNRRKEKLPRYQPPKKLLDSIKSLKLRRGFSHVLDGGLLHYKTSRVRDTVALWDILALDDQWLLGTTYKERYKLLKSICGNPRKQVTLSDEKGLSVPVAFEVKKSLWIARSFTGDFKKLFEKARQLPEIEGLVLKDPNAKLERAFKMSDNAKWQIRVRKPRIDYAF